MVINILIIKMHSGIMIFIIPSLVVSGAIMVMGACLSFFTITCITIERWRSVNIIRLPWRVHQCLFSLDVLRTSFFRVPQTCIERLMQNLQWLGYALATNTKSSSFVPHLGEESHVGSCNGDLHTFNRNDIR